MQTRPFFPETRKAKILTTTAFIIKWTIILGAAQAFAALLIFANFVNNYSYFAHAAEGDATKFCTPYLHSLQKQK